MVARVERLPIGGALAAYPPPRTAAGPGFREALGRLRLPAGVGLALTGVPVALSAIDQLNMDPSRPGANAAGAAGATIGGGLGALLGKFGGPLAPVTVPLGAYLGSQLGGGAGRNLYDGVSGLLQGSPEDQAIRSTEKMFRSQLGMGFEALPLQQAQAELAYGLQQRAAREEAAIRAQQLYQQAALNSAAAPVGRYMDPSFMPALGQIGSSFARFG